MSDAFTRYELALEQLLARLGTAHPRAAEARTLQARLLENVAAARLHGDTETRRAERSEIRAALDRLAGEALDVTFNELAFSPDRAAEAGEAPAAMAGLVFLAYSPSDRTGRPGRSLHSTGVALSPPPAPLPSPARGGGEGEGPVGAGGEERAGNPARFDAWGRAGGGVDWQEPPARPANSAAQRSKT